MCFVQEQRVKYNKTHYKDVFHDEPSINEIHKSVSEPTLLDLVQVQSISQNNLY